MLYRFPSICDRGHTIKEEMLNEIVLKSLKDRLSMFKVDEYTGKVIDEFKKNDANYKLLEGYKKRNTKIEADITKIYSKKLEGSISVEEFKEEYAKLKLEKKDVESNIENLESICKDSEIDSRLKEIIINFKNGIDFDNETIKILIDRIEVFEDRTISIIYKI